MLPPGVLLSGKRAPANLLTFAARRGFANLLVPHMEELYRAEGLGGRGQGRMPTTELALATALINHVPPDASDEEIKQYLEYRRKADTLDATGAVSLHFENPTLVEHFYDDDDDREEVKQFLEKKLEADRVKEACARAHAAASAPSASRHEASSRSMLVVPRPRLPFPEQPSYEQAELTAMIPAV